MAQSNPNPFTPTVCFPSGNFNRAKKTVPAWLERGYNVLIMLNVGCYADGIAQLDPNRTGNLRVMVTTGPYGGYFRSANDLTQHVFYCTKALAVVCAGDDMFPDEYLTANGVLERYFKHFPDLSGVYQPIGDDLKGTDQICGSPWIGRAFAEGFGFRPYFDQYFHFYGDEELKLVSAKAGKLVMDRAVTQRHDHWSRPGNTRTPFDYRHQTQWDEDKTLFEARRNLGFPRYL